MLSKLAVDETFNALFALSDLRCIFRKIKPKFEINSKEREKIEKIIKKVRKSMDIVERELKIE